MFTGLGPGGLNGTSGFNLDRVCIPGSSHGGIALPSGYALYSDQAYDKQDIVSLLGGSGGEINYLIILNERWKGWKLINKKKKQEKNRAP